MVILEGLSAFPTKRGLLVGVAALALAGSTVAGVAATGPTNLQIRACTNARTATIRIVSATATCRPGERMLVWNRQGTAGATGAAGALGLPGIAGLTGVTGAQGATGSSGATGPTGTTGAAGTDGTNGAAGTDGAAGTAGADGATGPMGPQGPAGTDGLDGATGPMGPQGPAGAAGADGAASIGSACSYFDAGASLHTGTVGIEYSVAGVATITCVEIP